MSELDCFKVCPERNRPGFLELMAKCEDGVRIRLDREAPRNDDGAELAYRVCGSPDSPNADVPSMAMADYSNTLVPMSELRKLYDQGLLPEQRNLLS